MYSQAENDLIYSHFPERSTCTQDKLEACRSALLAAGFKARSCTGLKFHVRNNIWRMFGK
ncbi:hypothetical protein Q5752_000060 [Cryptotrichosporon argae]